MAEYGEVGRTARGGPSHQKSYIEYLELPALLSLQRPLADPPVHDEMLFVIVHQTHELWFKQIVFELRALIGQIDERSWLSAQRTANRVSCIVDLLVRHVEVLETMPAEEFQRFRAVLGAASGMQSEQFKLIEELAGALPRGQADAAPAVAARGSVSQSVREAFLRAIAAVVPANDTTSGAALGRAAIFRDPARAGERQLAERLLHLDAEMARWRVRHMELARAMIGNAPGTGGSSGARYLEGTLDKRFFPELWSARAGTAAT